MNDVRPFCSSFSPSLDPGYEFLALVYSRLIIPDVMAVSLRFVGYREASLYLNSIPLARQNDLLIIVSLH
jgi:hypothetical protein